MHLTFCELILKDSVGKGATQCTFDELINKRPGSIIRDVRVLEMIKRDGLRHNLNAKTI